MLSRDVHVVFWQSRTQYSSSSGHFRWQPAILPFPKKTKSKHSNYLVIFLSYRDTFRSNSTWKTLHRQLFVQWHIQSAECAFHEQGIAQDEVRGALVPKAQMWLWLLSGVCDSGLRVPANSSVSEGKRSISPRLLQRIFQRQETLEDLSIRLGNRIWCQSKC